MKCYSNLQLHVDILKLEKRQGQESIPTGHFYAKAVHKHQLVAAEAHTHIIVSDNLINLRAFVISYHKRISTFFRSNKVLLGSDIMTRKKGSTRKDHLFNHASSSKPSTDFTIYYLCDYLTIYSY